LFHVQLNEGAHPAQRLVVTSEVFGTPSRDRHRFGQAAAGVVAQCPRPVGGKRASDQP
jgi:hypothetical protein